MSRPTNSDLDRSGPARRIVPVGSLVLVGLVLAFMLLTWILVKPPRPPAELHGVLRSEFRQLDAFQLSRDKRGPVTEASLRGKWSFFFFGYLSCPDVCPATLHELGRFWGLFADDPFTEPENLQMIFVSVDPERDSTEKLARYASYFNPSFIGATAGKGQIDRLTRQFSAAYVIEAETAPGEYLVSHTSAVFLVDPYGRLVASFSQPHYATTMLSQFRKILDYYEGAG